MGVDIRLIIIVLLFMMTSGFSQTGGVCSGNLGENIFSDGDFGVGVANIPSEDPRTAPGYSYVRSGPPNDGSYTITNDMGRWANNFGTWLGITDNSSDPNGYMMVVNASFSPGLFYEQTIDGLCENTLFEFSADAINVIQRNVSNHIKPNISFLINDEVVINTGDIPQDEQWHTYGITFSTKPGETAVKLSLRNNAPGGIGNDLALDNISFRACGPEALILPREVANICEDGDPIILEATIIGDQYPDPALQWQRSFDGGQTWEDLVGANEPEVVHDILQSGFYNYRYLLANSNDNLANGKCRVVSNVKTVHVLPKFYNLQDSICEGLSFQVGSSIYQETGIYTDSLISSLGCDSIVTLDLTVLPDPGIQANIRINPPNCAGEATAVIFVENIRGGYAPYLVEYYDTFGHILPGGSGVLAGDYRILIEDRYGCRLNNPVTIEEPTPFIIELGPDTSVVLGESINLIPFSNYPIEKFNWTPNNFPCGEACLDVDFFPIQSDIYRLDATNANGCQTSDSLFIEVAILREVFVPNTFSPNGDGMNDFFTVFGRFPLVQQIEKLEIFDRWGTLIYTAGPIDPNIPELGWDGRVPNQNPGNQVFVYQVSVRFFDGAIKVISGDVLLVR